MTMSGRVFRTIGFAPPSKYFFSLGLDNTLQAQRCRATCIPKHFFCGFAVAPLHSVVGCLVKMTPRCSEGFVVGLFRGTPSHDYDDYDLDQQAQGLRIEVQPVGNTTLGSLQERLTVVVRALHTRGPNNVLPCDEFDPPSWKRCSSCRRTHMTNANALRCVEFIVRSERNDVQVKIHFYASPGKWEYGRNRYVYENICTECFHAYVRWIRNTRPFVCSFRFVEDDRADYARRHAMWKFVCRSIPFPDYCQLCDQLAAAATEQTKAKPVLLSASSLLAVKTYVPPPAATYTPCTLSAFTPCPSLTPALSSPVPSRSSASVESNSPVHVDPMYDEEEAL